MSSNAALTVGLAVFNGAPLVQTAIDSLLAQSRTDFALIISDNASTDETQRICERAAARDRRIAYIRQPRNFGGFNNWKFLLNRARTPYFMWAAHDDWWAQAFVEKNIARLEADPHAIASLSRVAFMRDGIAEVSKGTFSLCGTVPENLRRFWWPISDMSRFYAIYRTEILRRSFPDVSPCNSFDALLIARTLRYGHHVEVPEVLMKRAAPDRGRYERQYKEQKSSSLRLFPALPATFWAVKLGACDYSVAGLMNLFCFNLAKHQDYLKFWHPGLYRVERVLYYLSGIGVLRRLLKTVKMSRVPRSEARGECL